MDWGFVLRSWWCCNHAPKGCHLAVVILSWALFSLLFCMPSFVTGQFVSRQNEVQDYSVDSSACGDHIKARASLALDSFVGDISGKLVESKDIQQSSIRGKHFCGYSQPCSPCMPAGFTAETDNSQRYSDEDAAKSSGKSLRWNQISNTYETKGERQDKSTENVTFRLIDGRTTVSCFPSSSHESNKETSIQTGKLEQMKTVTCGGSSSPNVAISPTVMEWGPQPVFSPSVAYLTVVNTCNDTVLHVFKPFSTNSQFYAYGFEQTVVASGEMISIAFVFLPRMLGLSGGHIILQTSSGGFLIQAQGEGVESPYRIEPFTGLNAFSGTRFRDNMTLYNPFDEMIFVEEVFAWVANSEAGLTQPAGAVCKTNGAFETSNKNLLQNEDAWFEFGKDAMDISLLGIRPSGRWEISPQCSSTIMEIDVSTHMEGKILGALCIRLKNSLRDTSNTVIVPLEVQIANIVENNPLSLCGDNVVGSEFQHVSIIVARVRIQRQGTGMGMDMACTPTSPASPITPIASSRPVSPLVKTVWQSNLMPSNSGGANDLEHPAESAGYKSLVVHKFPGITLQRDGDDVSQAGLVADVFKKHSAEVSGSKLPDESSFKQSSSQKQLSGVAAFSSKAISKQKNAGEGAVASGDWAAVAKRSADLSLNNSKFMRSDKTVLDSSSKMVRPMLTTSATFPFGGRRESNSGWHLPVLLDPKQTMVSSPSTPSLVSRSAIAPHARAPGTKFTKNESVSREHNTRGKSELIEQQSTYDIWGNHFAEFHLMSRSNVSAATTGQTKRSMYSSSEDYSQSYFSRFAPQTHLEKVTVPSLSSSASESFRPFPTD